MTTDTRKILAAWISSGLISQSDTDEVLKLSGVRPDGKAWKHFFDFLLLWSGTVALGVAVIFFIAFNWSEMGRLFKFALVEVLLVISIFVYIQQINHSLINKAALLFATLCLGGLMALFGQTYQTGADPWQLFFNWALFMLPWAIIGRFSVLWLIWLVLINLALLLYYQVFRGIWGIAFSQTDVLWVLFALNTCALVCWETLASMFKWLSGRWSVRLIATASGTIVTWLCLHAIFDSHDNNFAGLVWMIWIVSVWAAYRFLKQDLFMLAGMCLSAIIVITSFIARHLIDVADAGALFLISNLVLAMGAGSAFWLKNVNKEWRS